MNIFQQFAKSLYSPKHIAMYRFQGIGKTIGYVFFIMLISCLPFMIFMTQLATNGLSTFQSTVKNEFPPFSIENGILYSAENETKIIQTNNTKMIFDPSGTITENDVKNSEHAIGLLKNEIIIYTNGQWQSFPYFFPEDTLITNDKMVKYTNTLQSYLVIVLPILFLFYYLFVSSFGFMKVSIFAGIALLINKLLQRKLNYRQSWRIAAYAITPAILIMFVFNIANFTIPYSFILDWAIIVILLYLSIKSMPLPKR